MLWATSASVGSPRGTSHSGALDHCSRTNGEQGLALERQVVPVRVALPGLRPEGGAPHLRQQPLQPGTGLLDLGQARLRIDAGGFRHGQSPLQIRHTGRADPARCHGARIPHNALPCLQELPPESPCRSYPASRGRRRRSARTALQSKPSNSAENCAEDSRRTPSDGFGQWNAFGMPLEPVAGHASPLQLLVDQHEPGLIPHQALHPVAAFRPEQEQRAAVGVVPQHALHDQREARVQGACVTPLGRRSPFTPCGNRKVASPDRRG